MTKHMAARFRAIFINYIVGVVKKQTTETGLVWYNCFIKLMKLNNFNDYNAYWNREQTRTVR